MHRLRAVVIVLGASSWLGCAPFRCEPAAPRTESFPGMSARLLRADAKVGVGFAFGSADHLALRIRATYGTRLREIAVVPFHSAVCGGPTSAEALWIDGDAT